MTKYDDARRGMTNRRRTAQPQRGRYVPEIIDGEVVAIEVHDDDPRLKVGPVAPDRAGLQESLDQIERLAAELKEIAEVITPAPGLRERPASAAQARFDQMRAQQLRRRGGARQPEGEARPARAQAQAQAQARARGGAAGAGAGAHHGVLGAEAHGRGPGATAGRATVAGSTHPDNPGSPVAGSTPGTRSPGSGSAGAASGRSAGSRLGPHNAPPTTSPTAVAAPGTTRPHQAAAEAGRKDGDPFAGWTGSTATGRSVVQEPLPPDPKRRADEALIFGAPEADPKPDAARHVSRASVSATAKVSTQAADARPADARSAGKKPTDTRLADTGPTDVRAADVRAADARPASTAPARARRANEEHADTGLADKRAADTRPVDAKTAAAIPVAELGVPRAAPANEKPTAPAGRPAEEPRHPSGRSAGRRGHYTAIIIGAFVLAVPAFALGVVQPWNTSTRTGDKLSAAIGDGALEPPSTGGGQALAIPTTSPTPSAAYVAPIAPQQATAGQAGGQTVKPPKPPVSPPPTRRSIHPVGLTVSARADDLRPTAGESVRIKLTWKDGSGHLAGATQQWGDGSPTGGSIVMRRCTGGAPPANGAIEATHTFREAGKYTVRLSVTTYTCDGRTETQTVSMTIVVAPKPSPSPAPTSSPSEPSKPGE